MPGQQVSFLARGPPIRVRGPDLGGPFPRAHRIPPHHTTFCNARKSLSSSAWCPPLPLFLEQPSFLDLLSFPFYYMDCMKLPRSRRSSEVKRSPTARCRTSPGLRLEA